MSRRLSGALSVPKTANELAFDVSIRRAIDLERLKRGTVNKILRFVNDKVLVDLTKQIATAESAKELGKLIRENKKFVESGYALAYDKLDPDLKSLADVEANWNARQLRIIGRPLELDFTVPSTKLLESVVTTEPFKGRLLKDWFGKLSEDTLSRVVDATMTGIAQGESVSAITNRIRGTKSANYTDGILQASRREVETAVRTSVTQVSTRARELTFQENDDLISEVQFVATLDSRTSPICRSLDGKTFPVDEGPRPPLHPNCRSTIVPVLKSFKDLGFNVKSLPAATRASFNGQVPERVTYGDWLKKQSKTVQEEVLGVEKADLFRSGEVKFDRFTDETGRSLTLEELR